MEWEIFRRGSSTYYSQTVVNLFQASDLLKQLPDIPGLTYYIVETPDGNLGRDMNGYFTEGPLKTMGLAADKLEPRTGPVDCQSLLGFGNMQQNQMAVVQIRRAGSYAKLVLLMKCGSCGYESPVETEAGAFSRECYQCGVENNCQRMRISIILGDQAVDI
jgi:hypothetical protein